jgi:GT2 family glycosyltransferase
MKPSATASAALARGPSVSPVAVPAPAVSFIVPLFNCLALTQAMLASLTATLPTDLAYELILIDDGSTDGTRAWLSSLRQPATSVLLNDRNLGFAATNNRAAAVARGERLVLLNNDLVLLPGWFETLLAAHRSLGRPAGIVGNVQLNAATGVVDHAGIVFNAKAKPEHDRRPPSRWARRLTPVRRVPAVTAACAMVSAKLWQQLGGFDEGFVNGGEDVDLCFRARAAGRVNAVALRSTVRHHISSSTGRKLRDEANSERLALRWRREFVECAARDWCRDYLAIIREEPRNFDPAFALRLALYAWGLTQHPPRPAIAALDGCLELEFIRWRALREQSAGKPH